MFISYYCWSWWKLESSNTRQAGMSRETPEYQLIVSCHLLAEKGTHSPLTKQEDLHFREQFSLLQLILFFFFQLSAVAFLHQKQFLPDLVVYALHLGIKNTHLNEKTDLNQKRRQQKVGMMEHLQSWISWGHPRGPCPLLSTCWTWPCWSRSSQMAVSTQRWWQSLRKFNWNIKKGWKYMRDADIGKFNTDVWQT